MNYGFAEMSSCSIEEIGSPNNVPSISTVENQVSQKDVK
ncbi:MAG: hypothetical protein ACI9DK_001813 [Vicingaceae bacterium]|jgi:hypothetical protein